MVVAMLLLWLLTQFNLLVFSPHTGLVVWCSTTHQAKRGLRHHSKFDEVATAGRDNCVAPQLCMYISVQRVAFPAVTSSAAAVKREVDMTWRLPQLPL